MADVSILSRLVNGLNRNVSISANTLVMTSLKLGTSELTKAKLDLLALTVDSPTAVDASAQHHHDGSYFTKAEVGSTTDGSSGASIIGVDQTPAFTNISGANLQALVESIDTALGTAGGNEFVDNVFRINGSVDATSQLAFEVDAIATATIRTVTMPDANVNLGALTDSNIASAAAIAVSKLAAQTVSKAAAYDASGFLTAAVTTTTELNFVNGVTSAIQTQLDAKLALAGGTMSGAIAMGSNKITGLADGLANGDAVNLSQLNAAFNNLDRKDSVRLVSTSNVALTGEQTIDGVLTSADRVLLVGQTTASQNGIYVTAAGAWSRSTDADISAEVTSGLQTTIEEGTAKSGTIWLLTTADPITLDTTSLTFTELSVNSFTASLGVQIVGTDIRADLLAAGGLKLTGNQIGIEPLDFAGTGLEDDGADNMRLAAQGNGIAGGAGTTLSVSPDTTSTTTTEANAIIVGANGVSVKVDDSSIEGSLQGSTGAETIRVKASGVTNAMLAGSIATTKMVDSAALAESVTFFGATNLSGAEAETLSNGSNADTLHNHKIIKESMVAGEAFAANSSFLVRRALNGETAGRVYKADKAAGASGSETNTIYVLGIAHNTTASIITAGSTIEVIMLGEHTLESVDTDFTALQDEGLPVYLGAAGAFTLTAPSATNDAIVHVGNVSLVGVSSSIDMRSAQILGINA